MQTEFFSDKTASINALMKDALNEEWSFGWTLAFRLCVLLLACWGLRQYQRCTMTLYYNKHDEVICQFLNKSKIR
jgi:hypothetical protein